MVADVTTFIRILNDYDDQNQKTRESVGGVGAGTSSALITRDLLGGCSTLESKELDLDLKVPSGWEKRLDLKSGKVYIQKCNSPNSSSPSLSSSESKAKQEDIINFPPQTKKSLNLLDDIGLKLRLSTSSSSSPSSCYQSVCTLDKVKCALERAKNESNYKKRSKYSSSNSNSSSSIKETGMEVDEEVEKKPISSSLAVGCPSCLLYVLILKNNPQCPRCHTTVPLPQTDKRPKIDLNISI
ncbi:uncharacterized protein LOC124939766 [Impatiens glandulifera]|uniref:uncharacterized protein LOC124939766 n=1 Tax=Impatiens glandulifera TaxID=253017 RepID=UPI001FB0D266|nr:uncharacterized protein LOC124939766 [Impatiens glandulifera]